MAEMKKYKFRAYEVWLSLNYTERDLIGQAAIPAPGAPVIRKILTNLGVKEKKENHRAPSVLLLEYTQSIRVVRYEDGQPEYVRAAFEIEIIQRLSHQ